MSYQSNIQNPFHVGGSADFFVHSQTVNSKNTHINFPVCPSVHM